MKETQFITGDFAIYYPVKCALIIETDTPRLINHINNNPVQKYL